MTSLLLCTAAGILLPIAAARGGGATATCNEYSNSVTMAAAAKAVKVDRVAGALWGLFAGDAIAMPVHWYYNLRQIKLDFGKIEG